MRMIIIRVNGSNMLNVTDVPSSSRLGLQTFRYRESSTSDFRDSGRFRVEILEKNGRQILRVTDRLADNGSTQPLFEWHGALARQLHKCGVLGTGFLQSRVQFRDKSFVQHLALAAASAELAGEGMQTRFLRLGQETN